MKKLICIPFLFCTLFIFSQSATNKIGVTDLLNIKTVSSIAINKQETQLLFTLQTIEPEINNKWEYKYVNQIYIANISGDTTARQLTFAKEGSTNAIWHPNGKSILFTRVVEGKAQLFQLNLSGGEALQLTKFKYGVSNAKFNSSGDKLLFTAAINLKDLLSDSLLNPNKEIPTWSYEKVGFADNKNLKSNTAKANPDGSIDEIRAYLENNEKDKKAKVITKLNFQEESTTSNELFFTHVFIVDAQVGATPKPITNGFYSYSNPQFVAESNTLIVEKRGNNAVHPDRNLETSIWQINLQTLATKQLLGAKDKAFSIASISTSGKLLAYQFGSTSFVSIPVLAIIPISGSENETVVYSIDRNKNNFTWSNGDQNLYFTTQTNGGTILNELNITTKKIKELSSTDGGINSYAITKNNIFYSKHFVKNPSELYKLNTDGKAEKAITNFNNWVANKNISTPTAYYFTNEKGMQVQYWVMKPTNFEVGKKYPLLLEIHGGPSAMWGPGEAGMWHEYQYFCNQGYGVVYANPRGSSGYGENFLRDNINDWGNGPTKDVLTALDKTVAEGWADTSKLLITGGSYAGYLVSWIISHDNRFKAACSQRGVYELNTFFGEGNAWRLVPNYFGGYPWQANTRAILDRESPINYVQNINTPLIIFHGENDLRTGVIQSEMLYKSLKVLGKEVEYVRHPEATHEITRSGNNRQRIDQMLRTFEFFNRVLNKQ